MIWWGLWKSHSWYIPEISESCITVPWGRKAQILKRLGMTKIKTFVKTVTVSIKLKDDLLEDKIYFFALPQTNERIKMNK